ncbi:MAG TPA: hypothetical protein VEH86_07775 [Candidatus Acidoferrum sp.]|nr:hypothetical protein [Candidatus Acidoferrum sp.]
MLVLVAVYLVDLWFLSSYLQLSALETLSMEGVMLIILGLLFLVGTGGINLGSLSAAMISAKAKAIFRGDIAGPDEVLRRDTWKAKGFTRTALILLFSGVLMILVYFLTL